MPARLGARSRSMMLRTWISAVFSLMPSTRPIWRLVLLAATSAATSSWRGVSSTSRASAPRGTSRLRDLGGQSDGRRRRHRPAGVALVIGRARPEGADGDGGQLVEALLLGVGRAARRPRRAGRRRHPGGAGPWPRRRGPARLRPAPRGTARRRGDRRRPRATSSPGPGTRRPARAGRVAAARWPARTPRRPAPSGSRAPRTATHRLAQRRLGAGRGRPGRRPAARGRARPTRCRGQLPSSA